MKKCRVWLALFMSFVMGYVPTYATAQGVAPAAAGGGMITTSAVIADISRKPMEQNVLNALRHEDVKQALLQNGVSADEVGRRVASLSDSELRELSGQLNQARAGGDVLVTILVVVLIIFLVRRI